MRALLLLATVAVIIGGLLLVFLDPGRPWPPTDDGPLERPELAPSSAGAPADTAEDQAEPELLGGPETPLATDPESERTSEASEPLAGPTRPFRGIVMTQPEGQRPVQARFGSLDLEILRGGTRTPLTLDLPEGRFDAEVPAGARLVLKGGLFEGTRVRFEAPRGPFDPSPEEYALVAIPVPEIVLQVVEGGQDVPLSAVSVSRAEDPTGSWLGDTPPSYAVLVEEAESPVTLPDLEAKRPIWLRVSAEGYAATHVMIDPRKPGEKTVRLHPAGELDLRVSGRRRGDLRMIVLGREEPDGRTPHVATFNVTGSEIERDQDGVLFPIRGLAALPHRIVAKGMDRFGRVVDLGEVEVAVEPGLRRTATLRVD